MLNMISASEHMLDSVDNENQVPSLIDSLLESYADVFEVPTSLLPKRSHDHKIPLKEGTQPINIRPYWHPPTQKDAIETMVKELINSGVIRHSQSSFSSPVRKFTLVCFDGIIVYNPDMESHLFHLSQVLEVMRRQQLYAKRSKCIFGATQVEYLGHIITDKRVATNPNKVRAMIDWPVPGTIKQLRVAIEELKLAMASVPVLQMPDFDKTFIIETDASGGHSGMQATTKKMCEVVYWKKMRKQIKQFIREGDACQRNKPELVLYPRMLQSLPIHHNIWTEISMDFIDGLPMSKGRAVIMVIVDRLSNYRDVVFMSKFWKELFTRLQVQLHTSTTYHPQTDGQTEVVNSYNKGESMVEAVDESLVAKETSIQMLRFHMKRAQDKMKSLAGKSRSEREFDLETWRVGKVAYKLQLPASAQIHHVFHVSQLKKYKGPTPMFPGQLPTLSTKGLMIEEPFAVLDMRIAKGGNVAAVYVLIQWANGTPADATWELCEDIYGKLKGRGGRINLNALHLVYKDDEYNYNYYMMYKLQKCDLDNAMEMRSKILGT
ncbi:retrotransposable element Tf2 [Tanacetum coccineum]